MSQLPSDSFWHRLRSWVWQRRTNAVILGIILVLVVMQWPMLKGVLYQALGSPIPADTIPWRKSYQAALDESARTGKPVLVDFSASWCPPCQVMRREVWPDAQVGRLAADSFIPVLIDVDDQATQDIAARYDVSTIPTVIVVDSKGTVLARSGFLSRDSMIRFLKDNASERKAL